jgi:hypothetical protein
MEALIIPVVAILMPLFLVPTIITLKHRHQRREWEHRERMKAMELGLPVPRGQDTWGGKSVLSVGAGVPIASAFAAFLTCTDGPPEVDRIPLAAIAWGSAALISGGAMITSLILALLLARSRTSADPALADHHAKPVFDPDSFDVVGARA